MTSVNTSQIKGGLNEKTPRNSGWGANLTKTYGMFSVTKSGASLLRIDAWFDKSLGLREKPNLEQTVDPPGHRQLSRLTTRSTGFERSIIQKFKIDKFLKAFEHVARVRGRIENARPEVRAIPPRRELNDVIEFFSEMEAVVRGQKIFN